MTSAMDRITARAQARLDALEHAHRELAGVSATARADDGCVVVRVDASGGLAELRLLPGAARGDAVRLAALITETAAEAAREVAQRRADLTREFLDEFGGTPSGEGTGEGAGASDSHTGSGQPDRSGAGSRRAGRMTTDRGNDGQGEP